MLKKVDEYTMYKFLREIYPTADSNALMKKATQCIKNLDSVFDDIILNYCMDGTLTEYTHGEFSLSLIMSICNCNFPQAVLFMDNYIKNPVKGKADILHR